MKGFLTLLSFFGFIQIAASLSLTLQSTTFVTQPSLLFWARQPEVDGNDELDFDLRFVQGTDQKDAGMAASGIHAPSTQQFGTVKVSFPKQGTYQVIAVDGSKSTIATSNSVSAVPAPASVTKGKNKAGIIVGSIIGALAVIGILAAVAIFIIRRRRSRLNDETRRWTFQPDMMIQQPPDSRPPSSRSPSSRSSYSSESTITNPQSQDLEQGVVHDSPPSMPLPSLPIQDPKPRMPEAVIYPYRMGGPTERRPTLRRLDLDPTALPRSPLGPRPHLAHPSALTPSSSILRRPGTGTIRPMSPIPRSPSPRTHRQRAIADQIELLRIQMLEVERAGDKKDYIRMSEMSDKMAWLREQQEGPWALGLTEVTPLGYDRYMTC